MVIKIDLKMNKLAYMYNQNHNVWFVLIFLLKKGINIYMYVMTIF